MMTVDVEHQMVPEDLSGRGLASCLGLFSKLDIPATFFVTGKFAERHSPLVELISSRGHEVANHGYSHRDLLNLVGENLRREIVDAQQALEAIARKKTIGFRCPNLRFNKDIFAILKENGYLYDSSVHPTRVPFRYDNRNYPLEPFSLNGVLEIPISVTPKLRLPIGWFWLRNFGVSWSLSGAKALIEQGIDVVFYAHNWEFTDISHLNISWTRRRRTGAKFQEMISEFVGGLKALRQDFITMRQRAEIEIERSGKTGNNT
nr:polysaccharide deacetylase family protein [Candidatus Njordarchaeum guaymaensis]